MFFGTEGALDISIDCNKLTRSRHLKLQISIVQDCIKVGESSLSEQCVITTVERDDIEDQVFALEVVWRTEDYF